MYETNMRGCKNDIQSRWQFFNRFFGWYIFEHPAMDFLPWVAKINRSPFHIE